MNILFLTLVAYENINDRGIYHDFVREIARKGEKVFVISPRERRYNKETELVDTGNIISLRVKTGNITKTNFIEKGISTLRIERDYLKSIKKYFNNIRFDMVIYSTPPITFYRIIKHFKEKQNSITYLLLKDIFPQNAVDLGLMKKNGFIYKYFRKKEKKLYKISDYIGCMSEKNRQYILDHNKIEKYKIEIFPNSIKPLELEDKEVKNNEILTKYEIPIDKTLFIYGGNLGKPQGIDFLLEVIENFEKIENSFLLIVGSGTEYNKIKNFLEIRKLNNVKLMGFLPKREYDELVKQADVGLIFLDKRFTIPNYPSRLTVYMENYLPILAATDEVTDIKETIENSRSGFWCKAGDLESFLVYANKLANDEKLRKEMGRNARKYLEENFNIEKNINIILDKLYNWREPCSKTKSC